MTRGGGTLRGSGSQRPAASFCVRKLAEGAPRFICHHPQPTTHPSSHPVRRRPTQRGAGVVHGVQVERATVRMTWTPWAASARLCLGRRWTGWELPAHATTDPLSGTAPPPSRCRPIPRRRHCLDRRLLYAVLASWPPALSTSGRASAQRGRSGAQPGLDEVEKPVTGRAYAVGAT
jgi:hypothetical protein